MNQKAFTLIELLVVVLIIGILTAIALPQYQKAVEKSKAVQAITLLRAIYQSERMYTMMNGSYPSKFSQLDVKIPYLDSIAGRIWYTGAHDTLTNKDWTAQIVNYSYWHMLAIGRVAGPYQGAGWVIIEKYQYANYPTNEILCTERRGSSNRPFRKAAGEYCEKLFHATRVGQTNFYRLP